MKETEPRPTADTTCKCALRCIARNAIPRFEANREKSRSFLSNMRRQFSKVLKLKLSEKIKRSLKRFTWKFKGDGDRSKRDRRAISRGRSRREGEPNETQLAPPLGENCPESNRPTTESITPSIDCPRKILALCASHTVSLIVSIVLPVRETRRKFRGRDDR